MRSAVLSKLQRPAGAYCFLRAAVIAGLAIATVLGCDRDREQKTGDESEQDPRFSADAEAAADGRRASIEQEIADLKDHLWAGRYYHGDGLGVNASLWLAPQGGFVFLWTGCLGVYDRNYGNVTGHEDGTIELGFTFPNDREGFRGVAPKLLPVRWGERRYLIPADEVPDFCNAINSGREPRDSNRGFFFLRNDDHAKPASSRPELPAQYRPYLLDRPIHATITRVLGTTTKPSRVCEMICKTTRVTIDVGRVDGVLAGMQFDVQGPLEASRSLLDLEVTKVSEHEAEGAILQIEGLGDEELPEAGWHVVAGTRFLDERQPTTDGRSTEPHTGPSD